MKIRSLLISLLGIILLTGCGKTSVNTVTLKLECDEEESTVTLKAGDTFDCELIGEKYTFTINKITDTKIKISSDKYGLTKVKDGTTNLLEKDKDFKIVKDTPTELATQSTDYQESIIITWEK